MRLTTLAATIALGLAPLPAFAAEEISHYAAEPSQTLAEALATLADYDARVETVLARDMLGVQDMDEIHEYTYTMENAVARIATEVEEIAAALEEVHQSSEGDDPDALRAAAKAYLALSAPLIE
ncbi:DNA repair ATPase RecN [Roseovarius sp. MBR-78]|uniref:DUF6746 family protein n=1 Tax=Roseovarius sp. MBR-78 TaxID=3156460 RepID=UPI003390EDFC